MLKIICIKNIEQIIIDPNSMFKKIWDICHMIIQSIYKCIIEKTKTLILYYNL